MTQKETICFASLFFVKFVDSVKGCYRCIAFYMNYIESGSFFLIIIL